MNGGRPTVILGFDMETDIGSWTPFYEGLINGTPKLLTLLQAHGVRSTFFFTGSAARKHPGVVEAVAAAGHEIGCHSLYHETVGEALFDIPGMSPLLESEIRPRLELATQWVSESAGGRDICSFRCPRLFGGSTVIEALEQLGYVADASLPMYYYTERLTPYHPDAADWSRPGRMRILEFPNFADVTIRSSDPYGRDRDQWPLFRTASAEELLRHVDSFVAYVRGRKLPVVLTFYFHPWEFWPMPQGPIHYGEGAVVPDEFLVANCGDYALDQFSRLLDGLKARSAAFDTCGDFARSMARL